MSIDTVDTGVMDSGRRDGGTEDGSAEDGSRTDVDSGTVVGDDTGVSRDDTGIPIDLDTGIVLDLDGGLPIDLDAGGSCVIAGCARGQECCAASGACYAAGCLSCCMFPAPDSGITLPDADVTLPDAGGGTSCVDSGCGIGQTCCAASGRCYDPACLSCCMPRPGDAGVIGRDGGFSLPDTGVIFARDSGVRRDSGAGTTDDAGASCVTTGCARGQECCAASGRCYASGCLACCMFP